MKIFNFKLFLESNNNDDDFLNTAIEFKKTILHIVEIHEKRAHKTNKLVKNTLFIQKLSELIQKAIESKIFELLELQTLVRYHEMQIYKINKITYDFEQKENNPNIFSLSFLDFAGDVVEVFNRILETPTNQSNYNLILTRALDFFNMANNLTEKQVKSDEEVSRPTTDRENIEKEIEKITGKEIARLSRQDRYQIIFFKTYNGKELPEHIVTYLKDKNKKIPLEDYHWDWQKPKVI